jgi:hypothetical protein
MADLLGDIVETDHACVEPERSFGPLLEHDVGK